MAAPLQPAGVRAVAEGVNKYVGDMKRMGGATADMGSRLSQIATIAGGIIASQVFTRIADAFMSVARSAVEFGKESILTAARVQELDAVLGVVAKTAGIPKAKLDELVATIKDLGITTKVAQGLVLDFTTSQLDLADATALANVARNAAIFSMQDTSQALAGLIHGITTWNVTVLRTYGIVLPSSTKAFEVYAAMIGKTIDELTEAERSQAMLNAVIEAGTAIEGAYEAAMSTAGKQLRSMSRYIEELMENVGAPFLGAFAAVIKKIASWIKYFRDITAEGTVLNRMLKAVASIIERVFLKAANRLGDAFDFIMEYVVNLWEVIEAGQGIWGQLAHVFQLFMNRTKPLHVEILPRLYELFQRYLLPVIEKVMKAFVFFAQAIALGQGPVHAMIEALSVLVPKGLVPAILKLHEKWSDFVSSIREFLDKYKDEIVAGLKAIGLAITTYLIASEIIGALEILGVLLGSLNLPILLILGAVGALGIAWEKNFGGIRDKLAEFWEKTGRPVFESIREWLEKNIPKAIEKVTYFWEKTLLPAIKRVWLWVEENVFPIIQDLIAWLKEKIPEAVEYLKGIWENTLKPALENFEIWVQETVIPAVEDIVEWFKEKLPEAIEKTATWFKEKLPEAIDETIRWFQEDLPKAINELKEDFQPLIDKALELADAFIESGPKIQEELQKTSDFIRDTFAPSIVSSYDGMLENVTTAWKEHGDEIIEIVGTAMRVVLGTISGIMAFINNFVSAGLAYLRGDWEGYWDSLVDAVEGFIEPVLEALGTNLEELRTVWQENLEMLMVILADIPDRVDRIFEDIVWNIILWIEDTAADLVDRFFNFGADIITGLWDGLKSIWEDVKEWFTISFDDIISTMSSFLRLYSPSGLFEDIGQNMMAGLAKGIQSGAQLPAMAAQVALSQQVMPAVAGVTRNQEFNLNVSTSAPSEPVIADFQMLALLAELS